MVNCKVSVEKNIATIVIDLTQTNGLSGSKKTHCVGTTSGFTSLGDGIILSVNCNKANADYVAPPKV